MDNRRRVVCRDSRDRDRDKDRDRSRTRSSRTSGSCRKSNSSCSTERKLNYDLNRNRSSDVDKARDLYILSRANREHRREEIVLVPRSRPNDYAQHQDSSNSKKDVEVSRIHHRSRSSNPEKEPNSCNSAINLPSLMSLNVTFDDLHTRRDNETESHDAIDNIDKRCASPDLVPTEQLVVTEEILSSDHSDDEETMPKVKEEHKESLWLLEEISSSDDEMPMTVQQGLDNNTHCAGVDVVSSSLLSPPLCIHEELPNDNQLFEEDTNDTIYGPESIVEDSEEDLPDHTLTPPLLPLPKMCSFEESVDVQIDNSPKLPNSPCLPQQHEAQSEEEGEEQVGGEEPYKLPLPNMWSYVETISVLDKVHNSLKTPSSPCLPKPQETQSEEEGELEEEPCSPSGEIMNVLSPPPPPVLDNLLNQVNNSPNRPSHPNLLQSHENQSPEQKEDQVDGEEPYSPSEEMMTVLSPQPLTNSKLNHAGPLNSPPKINSLSQHQHLAEQSEELEEGEQVDDFAAPYSPLDDDPAIPLLQSPSKRRTESNSHFFKAFLTALNNFPTFNDKDSLQNSMENLVQLAQDVPFFEVGPCLAAVSQKITSQSRNKYWTDLLWVYAGILQRTHYNIDDSGFKHLRRLIRYVLEAGLVKTKEITCKLSQLVKQLIPHVKNHLQQRSNKTISAMEYLLKQHCLKQNFPLKDSDSNYKSDDNFFLKDGMVFFHGTDRLFQFDLNSYDVDDIKKKSALTHLIPYLITTAGISIVEKTTSASLILTFLMSRLKATVDNDNKLPNVLAGLWLLVGIMQINRRVRDVAEDLKLGRDVTHVLETVGEFKTKRCQKEIDLLREHVKFYFFKKCSNSLKRGFDHFYANGESTIETRLIKFRRTYRFHTDSDCGSKKKDIIGPKRAKLTPLTVRLGVMLNRKEEPLQKSLVQDEVGPKNCAIIQQADEDGEKHDLSQFSPICSDEDEQVDDNNMDVSRIREGCQQQQQKITDVLVPIAAFGETCQDDAPNSYLLPSSTVSISTFSRDGAVTKNQQQNGSDTDTKFHLENDGSFSTVNGADNNTRLLQETDDHAEMSDSSSSEVGITQDNTEHLPTSNEPSNRDNSKSSASFRTDGDDDDDSYQSFGSPGSHDRGHGSSLPKIEMAAERSEQEIESNEDDDSASDDQSVVTKFAPRRRRTQPDNQYQHHNRSTSHIVQSDQGEASSSSSSSGESLKTQFAPRRKRRISNSPRNSGHNHSAPSPIPPEGKNPNYYTSDEDDRESYTTQFAPRARPSPSQIGSAQPVVPPFTDVLPQDWTTSEYIDFMLIDPSRVRIEYIEGLYRVIRQDFSESD